MIRPLLSSLLLLVAACGASSTPSTPPAAPSSPASAMSSTPAAPSDAKTVDHVDVPPAIAAMVAAPDRSDDDKKLDSGRHPAELLAFCGIAPGMRVGEIAAGGGYTTELLARAVAPSGVVYAENPKFVLERFAEKPWSARLAKPVDKAVVRSDREPDDPFPPEARDLDAVVIVLSYHDTVWLGADRAKMNAAIFKALKKGGVYCVVDHSARDGAGVGDAKTLHRIEEKVVRQEIAQAGFALRASATFLRNPSDARDWNDSPVKAGDKRGTSDRFVLQSVKPEEPPRRQGRREEGRANHPTTFATSRASLTNSPADATSASARSFGKRSRAS